MIFRSLDANHDWLFGHGLANYLDLDAAIGLNIETRLLSWVGDCFFNKPAGIDWTNRLGSKNQKTLLDLDTRRIIQQSSGVAGITFFNSTLVGRAYTANYAVDTIYGQNYKNTVTVGVPNA